MAAQSHTSAISAFSKHLQPSADDFDYSEDAGWVLQPGERIAPPPRGKRSDAVLASALAVLIGLGIGMVLLDDRVRDPASSSITDSPAETAALPAAGNAGHRPDVPSAADLPTKVLARQPEPVGTPDDRPAAQPQASGESQAASAEAAIEPAEPLPPPQIDKDNPFQVRALTVGLHPGLSEALLTRLSAEDFRNAAIAIRTALAETADGQTYVWPTPVAAGQAQFHVRFVLGPAPDCRRYVVTVVKDRWATTALPMEKCGGGSSGKRGGRG